MGGEDVMLVGLRIRSRMIRDCGNRGEDVMLVGLRMGSRMIRACGNRGRGCNAGGAQDD